MLATNPDADVRVLVIWFSTYPGDAETKWRSDLLTDARAGHRWDEPKSAGRWFMTNLRALRPARGGDGIFPQRDDAMWDTYLLFDRRAVWSDAPTGLLSWGYTVMRTRAQLLKDFRFAVASR